MVILQRTKIYQLVLIQQKVLKTYMLSSVWYWMSFPWRLWGILYHQSSDTSCWGSRKQYSQMSLLDSGLLFKIVSHLYVSSSTKPVFESELHLVSRHLIPMSQWGWCPSSLKLNFNLEVICNNQEVMCNLKKEEL